MIEIALTDHYYDSYENHRSSSPTDDPWEYARTFKQIHIFTDSQDAIREMPNKHSTSSEVRDTQHIARLLKH